MVAALPEALAITEEEVPTMINEQTCETLRKMKLNAMADELTHQLEDQTSYGTLGFEERLGLMVDAEWNRRRPTNLPATSKLLIFPFPAQQLKESNIMKTVSLIKQKSYVMQPVNTLTKDTTSF